MTTNDPTDILARHLHDLAAHIEFGDGFEPYATLSVIGKQSWRERAAGIVAEMAEVMRPLLVHGRGLADKNIAPHLPTNASLLHRLLDEMFAVSHGYPVSSQFYAQAPVDFVTEQSDGVVLELVRGAEESR